ncbi:MAG: hypothetical protein Q8M33_13045, partial [Hydrogenophaga sp.]|nr:hypothetical protein [Hydrogenophaga sp.]
MTNNATHTRPLADLIKTHRAFGLLSNDTQNKLVDTLVVKSVAAGAQVCEPAELQQQLHWLVSGSVSLLDTHQQPVLTLHTGELFGLLPDGMAGVEQSLAQTDCTLV